MLWAYQKVRKVRTAFLGKNTPRQMAAGLACGLLLGLIPKGNLLALLVASTLLATRMSLATGMLCAFAISLVAPFCDPLTHRLGQWVLTNSAMVPLWRSISQLPLAAWTSFSNTVVMGNLTLGAILMYPVYRLSLPWMVRFQRKYAASPESRSLESSDRCTTSTTAPSTTAPRQVTSGMNRSNVTAPYQHEETNSPHLIPRRTHPRDRRSCA